MFYEKFNRYATAVEALIEIVEKDNEPCLRPMVDYLQNQKGLFGQMQVEQINSCPVIFEEVKPKIQYHATSIS